VGFAIDSPACLEEGGRDSGMKFEAGSIEPVIGSVGFGFVGVGLQRKLKDASSNLSRDSAEEWGLQLGVDIAGADRGARSRRSIRIRRRVLPHFDNGEAGNDAERNEGKERKKGVNV
jgi:hypothetical protein